MTIRMCLLWSWVSAEVYVQKTLKQVKYMKIFSYFVHACHSWFFGMKLIATEWTWNIICWGMAANLCIKMKAVISRLPGKYSRWHQPNLIWGRSLCWLCIRCSYASLRPCVQLSQGWRRSWRTQTLVSRSHDAHAIHCTLAWVYEMSMCTLKQSIIQNIRNAVLISPSGI